MVPIPTLLDVADWLEYELQVQEDSSRFSSHHRRETSNKKKDVRKDIKHSGKLTAILLSTVKTPEGGKGRRKGSRDFLPGKHPHEVLYVDRSTYSHKVLLKVSKVLLRNGSKSLEAYAVLDDGSEWTIILHAADQHLGLQRQPEKLALRIVREDLQVLHGVAVSFTVSPAAELWKKFQIQGAFTAEPLSFAEHTHPVNALQSKYRHLAGLPLQPVRRVYPVLLIGSECPHLRHAYRLGPLGAPAAVRTCLRWTLQGPAQELRDSLSPQQCCFTFTSPSADLHALQRHVLDHSQPNEDVMHAIENSFYVDNCLHRFNSSETTKEMVDKLYNFLASGGFELRQ
ncbi:hypothetical protein SKAU_G00398350 [Synaphobranchus kaupii]|uniref:Uncharacterized protein n=1 Tax=Synaphobranchus kaupii TaxID=118154 RepID=A0A9Q1E8J0_SYNKA|nr:hypothetical protein SKAU_G00398350 [Synaphobranchus kaupii]